MKGVIFTRVGAAPEVTDTLTKPEPADDQVLVKSLWTAINPVDTFMSSSGVLVVSFPLVLGVDAAGVVVSAGATAQSKYNLAPGTYVCGCTRLGSLHYSTVQEYYLMDAAVTLPKPRNVSVPESATLGVGTYTAALGLFDGLQVPLPDLAALPAAKDEWIVVLGGASSVGKFAVQIAKACGFQVLASCSAKNHALMASFGAASFDYRRPVEDQVQVVLATTGGKIHGVFDCVAENDPVLTKALFQQPELRGEKRFTTTNDWSAIGHFGGGTTRPIRLGEVGRPEAGELNAQIETYIPVIGGVVEMGKVKPSGMKDIGGGGWEGAIEALKFQQSGKGGHDKVVCKIGEESAV